MVKTVSKTAYNYATVKITQSRIDKGLLAIPVPWTDWFPKQKIPIRVFLDDSNVPKLKNYTPYTSSSRECRIGGLAAWFRRNHVRDGDEIVVQVIDEDNYIYRLIHEEKFLAKTQQIQNWFDTASDDFNAVESLSEIARWNNIDRQTAALHEFQRLIQEEKIEERKTIARKQSQSKESVPPKSKILLGEIYKGHCQICDFWFFKKDGTPYYEIHHIHDQLGNHLTNLLLVCGNCHNQFTYAHVKQMFRKGWLYRVHFNERAYDVNQIIFSQQLFQPTKQIFTVT
jgi:hypothetical protein